VDGGLGALAVARSAVRRDGLLSQKADVLKPPFLAQPGPVDDLEDLLERRIRIRVLGRCGRVFHGPIPLSKPEVFLRSCFAGGPVPSCRALPDVVLLQSFDRKGN
jgi:hypothetical protein